MEVENIDAFCIQLVQALGQSRSELLRRVLARLVRVVLRGERETTVLPFGLRGPRLLLAGHVRPRGVNLGVTAA